MLDFDGDDMISSSDLKTVITRLTGENSLNDEEMQQLIDSVSSFTRTSKCTHKDEFWNENEVEGRGSLCICVL